MNSSKANTHKSLLIEVRITCTWIARQNLVSEERKVMETIRHTYNALERRKVSSFWKIPSSLPAVYGDWHSTETCDSCLKRRFIAEDQTIYEIDARYRAQPRKRK